MRPDTLPRKLAAILYADVAAYSRLTGKDEEGTHRRLSEYLDLISSVEPGAHRALRIILVSLRVTEVHENTVAHVAGDEALIALYGFASAVLKCCDDLTEILGIEPGRERRGAHEITEHDCELSSLGVRACEFGRFRWR